MESGFSSQRTVFPKLLNDFLERKTLVNERRSIMNADPSVGVNRGH